MGPDQINKRRTFQKMPSLRVLANLLETIYLTEIFPLRIYSENKFYQQRSHIAPVSMKEILI